MKTIKIEVLSGNDQALLDVIFRTEKKEGEKWVEKDKQELRVGPYGNDVKVFLLDDDERFVVESNIDLVTYYDPQQMAVVSRARTKDDVGKETDALHAASAAKKAASDEHTQEEFEKRVASVSKAPPVHADIGSKPAPKHR